MKFFVTQINNQQVQASNQITPLAYFGQRETIIPDLFALLGERKYQCIYDPFSGSGSISFAAMQKKLGQHFYLNDSFPNFKHIWEFIRAYPQEFIKEYSEYVQSYCSQAKNERRSFYSKLLADFNNASRCGFYAKAAILFTFLTNYADKNLSIFDKNLQLVSEANVFIDIEIEKKNLADFTQRVMYLHELFKQYPSSFNSGDFLSCLDTASTGDLVILDPPYPSQAENIYFKLKDEQTLKQNIETAFTKLNEKKVDFFILYGARIVPLSKQFNEEKHKLHHLIRLSTHKIFGHFLDHIYVSRQLDLNSTQLPKGMAFYNQFFNSNEEMTQEQYQNALSALQSEKVYTETLKAKL
jgi:site-specific DNA-adenine methylase